MWAASVQALWNTWQYPTMVALHGPQMIMVSHASSFLTFMYQLAAMMQQAMEPGDFPIEPYSAQYMQPWRHQLGIIILPQASMVNRITLAPRELSWVSIHLVKCSFAFEITEFLCLAPRICQARLPTFSVNGHCVNLLGKEWIRRVCIIRFC